MKKLSITINIILLVAVGVLYYLHFSGGKQKSKSSLIKATIINDSSVGHSIIAYIELDSIYNQISYISSKRKELEVEQRGIETEWQNSYRGLENKKNEFLKKGAAITDAMAQEFQGELMQQKERVDSRKEELTEKLSEKQYRFMDDIQKKLKDFLASYNEQRQFSYIFTTGTGLEYMAYKDSALNITPDVINGMNEKLNSPSKR